MLRQLLVEDHTAFRGAMAMVLTLQSEMGVEAECGSLAQCRDLEGLGSVDVALLDLNLPDGEGTELVADFRAANPGVKVLMLSASLDPRTRERAAESGADGLLDKMTPPQEIALEVRRLAGVGRA